MHVWLWLIRRITSIVHIRVPVIVRDLVGIVATDLYRLNMKNVMTVILLILTHVVISAICV
jgi:hypothetical protein